MKTIINSYFLLLSMFLAGSFISFVNYGNFIENLFPHYPLGTYFIKGMFFLLPAILFLMMIGTYKKINKEAVFKSFLGYAFVVFLYALYTGVNVYTAKEPLADIQFWTNYLIYTVGSFIILLLFYIPYLAGRKFKDLFFVYLSFLLIASFYSYTLKRYFTQNRVVSTIFVGKTKIKGKIIAQDEVALYVITKRGLETIPHQAVDLIKIKGKD